MPPEELVARCVQEGMNCIAVTDHNTIDGALAVRAIAPFMVIIGEEIRSSEGEITGLFLKETVPRLLSPMDTVKRVKEQDGLVSIPHPFDWFRRSVISRAALEEIAPYADIVEVFNARNNLSSSDRKALGFAKDHGLLASGVSDSHTASEVGRTYVEMPDFDGTPEGFKRSLSQGTIVGRRMGPFVHVTTTMTKMKKRLAGRFRRP